MRLLTCNSHNSFSLTGFTGHEIPSYAILSHTWGTDGEEITFEDLNHATDQNKTGYEKLKFCAERAARDGLQYFWVDTCCIDKSDPVELQHAINSMFRWYQNASRCYVYLSDVESTENNHFSRVSWQEAFRTSRWFTRGWTLQELIAPKSVEFFSKQRYRLGDKKSLELQIHEITRIPIAALQGRPLSQFTIDERMSWAKHRDTKYEEDKVYSLQGIFDVYIPLIYGEGRERALVRLQREIQGYSKASSRAEDLPTPSSTVPFRRDPDFVDRGTILDDVKQKCEVSNSRTALVGLGGIGKSQLAIEYAYRVRDQSPDTWIFWVHASNAVRFEQSYRNIADKVKIPGRDNPKANIMKLVCDWLQNENKQKWLLILDNFDDATFLVQAPGTSVAAQSSSQIATSSQPLSIYLPQAEVGSILITTRKRDAALTLLEASDILTVGPMDTKDAELLFTKKVQVKENSKDVASLVALLELMPLAIVQAAAYITQMAPRCSARQYIEKFQRSDKDKMLLLDHGGGNLGGGHLRRDWEANNSILITWQLSFEHVRQTRPSAANLLSLMSFFDRQGIPEFLVHSTDTAKENDKGHAIVDRNAGDEDNTSDLGSDFESKDQFESDILILRNFSFISTSVDSSIFEMHGLVQLATRKWLRKCGHYDSWKQKYITKLSKEFPLGEHENWSKCLSLFPHAKGAIRQKPKRNESIEEWATLLYNAAWYAWGRGNIADAEEFSVKSMTARTKLFGVANAKTLNSMGMVGLVYKLGGRWKEAEDLEVQVVETSLRVFGQEHPDTLTSISNLASTYWNQGRWKEAEDLEAQVMESSLRVLGPEHPDTLISISNLALIYQNQGCWKEAEDLKVQVIESSLKVLGQEHPDTLTNMSKLASIYQDQGRWKEAENLKVQVIESRKRVLGSEHPDTLTSISNLASIYQDQGRWKEAEDIFVQVMESRKRALGQEHPDTLTSISNLASIYRDQGRWKEAENLKVQVIESRKRVLGPEHPDMLTSISNLASIYQDQGRWKEAEDIFVQVIELRKRALGQEHPDMLTSISNLASIYRDQGRWKEAEDLEVQVIEMRKRVLGPEHPETLRSIGMLALTLGKEGRWKEAEELGVSVVENCLKLLGPEHPYTLVGQTNLAVALNGQGRLKEAEQLIAEVIQKSVRVLDQEHPLTLQSLHNLATIRRSQGQWEEAEQLGVQIMETRKRLLGKRHPDTLESMVNLAYTWKSQGRNLSAILLLKKAVDLGILVLGSEHPNTISWMDALEEWET